MEYLITGIVKLPDDATPEEVAKFEVQLSDRVRLDFRSFFYDPEDRTPLVYWSFHALNCPFPLDWRDSERDDPA